MDCDFLAGLSFTLFNLMGTLTSLDCSFVGASFGGTGLSWGRTNVSFGAPFSCAWLTVIFDVFRNCGACEG